MKSAIDMKKNTGKEIIITGMDLRLDDIIEVAAGNRKVRLSGNARTKVVKSYKTVKQKIDEKIPVYGVTTGFGKLSSVAIDKEQSQKLQKNLIMSHACGVGNPFPIEVVRAIMLLRANTLANGFSGVNPTVVDTLISMLNAGVHPVIPEKGSLGASGDLANLAHIALVMLGLGEAVYREEKMDGAAAMEKAGIPVIELNGKDGLGLINGTQVMTALGALYLYEAEKLMKAANVSAALTIEALQGLTSAMDPRIHKVRPHAGQSACAEEILRLLAGSGCVNQSGRIQDAYSLRCVPQVHGASMDAIQYVKSVIETEMNSVTDNPIVFPDDGEIISGGNFHGQPLALALDFLAIALSELANISERRIERLVNPQLSGLPAFLAKESGINSGYMIVQYTAASLVSENKILASPASVDSIPSSANQEDHVSMGSISARKLSGILENLRHVLAIELMCAAQAVDLMRESLTADIEKTGILGAGTEKTGILGAGTEKAYRAVRERIPFLESDRVIYPDIEKITELLMEDFVWNI